MKIVFRTNLGRLDAIAQHYPDREVCWAMHTCWWSLWPRPASAQYMTEGPPGLPCDPRGSVLMQGRLAAFLESAKAAPGHYGRHRLLAFVAAFHGNLTTADGKPTSFTSWEDYNGLLDLRAFQ